MITSSDSFAVGCIVYPQYTSSQTDRQTDETTLSCQYYSRSYRVQYGFSLCVVDELFILQQVSVEVNRKCRSRNMTVQLSNLRSYVLCMYDRLKKLEQARKLNIKDPTSRILNGVCLTYDGPGSWGKRVDNRRTRGCRRDNQGPPAVLVGVTRSHGRLSSVCRLDRASRHSPTERTTRGHRTSRDRS